jgi:hypothetical protein
VSITPSQQQRTQRGQSAQLRSTFFSLLLSLPVYTFFLFFIYFTCNTAKETLAEIVEIDTAAQIGYDLQPIVIVECTRFAPAPIVVVRRESTPDGQAPVIIGNVKYTRVSKWQRLACSLSQVKN